MSRVRVYHLTPPRCLPLIEEEGLRTRADLSEYYGELDAFDRAAPGTFAHGKRVSAYLDPDHAGDRVSEHGGGLVSFTVDPTKTLAAPESVRLDEGVETYWEAAQPLAAWPDEPPADLEVHQNVPVRAKYLRLHAPLLGEGELGRYAPIVARVADDDRLMAKALMHLTVVASGGDFESPEFKAGCALAWRDEEDPDGLIRELVELDADKVCSAALAELHSAAPAAVEDLRSVLEETREWADANGLDHGQGLLARTAVVLEDLPASLKS